MAYANRDACELQPSIERPVLHLLQGLHISLTQYRVLQALKEDEDAFARDIATESGLRLRQVVGALRRLEGRKMICRTRKEYIRFPGGDYNDAWRWRSLIELTPLEVR